MLSYGFLRSQSKRPLDTSKATVTASVDFAPPGGHAQPKQRSQSLASGGNFSADELRDLVTGLFMILDSRGADTMTRTTDKSIESLTRDAVMLAAACFTCLPSPPFDPDLPSRLVPFLALPYAPVYSC